MTTVVDDYTAHWDWLAPFWDASSPEREAEEQYFLEAARASGGPVLDIACGTGRLLTMLADAGIASTGLDLSSAMLDRARRNVSALEESRQRLITLEHGDVRTFSLDRRFAAMFFSWSFIYLLTPGDQRDALRRMRDHLEPGGRLILTLPDPKIEGLPSHMFYATAPQKSNAFVRPDNGHTVIVWVSAEHNLEQQTVDLLTCYEELNEQGEVIAKFYKPLTMRFTFRYEMQYLLELCGFDVVALHGDFHGGPFRPAGAQIWVARRA
ncbi:MAG TPA: class I SAM-dependent methyltransferase [Vicinamibacterales bacterium]|nr:class I SAM-dependent methyltransferase [Vicinamibacterales bacterium]